MIRNKNEAASQSGGLTKVVKMLLVGRIAVGKTSLIMRITHDRFKEHHETTIGAAFSTKIVQVKDQTVRLNIWDTAGQERYRSMVPLYYRDASAAIVVYDITDGSSLDGAKEWIKELKQMGPADMIIYLAGNKLDLAMDERAVMTEEGNDLAIANGFMFAEVSAKTGLGADEMFNSIVSAVITQKVGDTKSRNQGGVTLNSRRKASSKCAC